MLGKLFLRHGRHTLWICDGYPASEKLEIIRTVEASHLPVKRKLAMLNIPSATYYQWYARWVEGGVDALEDRSPRPKSVWNRIPDDVRADFVEFALNDYIRHDASLLRPSTMIAVLRLGHRGALQAQEFAKRN